MLARFEKTKLRDLNRFDIQILLNELAKNKSESLVDKVFTYLKAAVLEALEQDFLGKNPCRKVSMPKIEHKPCERFLLLDEITTLDQHLKGRDRLLFRLFVLIGFRIRPALGRYPTRLDSHRRGRLPESARRYQDRRKSWANPYSTADRGRDYDPPGILPARRTQGFCV